jgi:2-haloacid dehalogenase
MGGSARSSKHSRRCFLAAGGASLVPIILARAGDETHPSGHSAPTRSREIDKVEALTFDVFGTVVDWRSSIIREGQLFSEATGLEVDWARFADSWASRYGRGVARIRKGEIPWMTIDELNREIVDELLQKLSNTGSIPKEATELWRIWHRLTPWPDALPGLRRLRSRYITATLSNANISLLVRMAKHAGLPWDCILSSELSGHYKPDREVYETAADLLDLTPQRIMMVASHKQDLLAARSVGFRTAYVQRPLEYGGRRNEDHAPNDSFDITADDFLDLAHQLGT